ncbi:MAG: hypothetical protein AB7O38_25335 [Pirellulaceae bacterium]
MEVQHSVRQSGPQCAAALVIVAAVMGVLLKFLNVPLHPLAPLLLLVVLIGCLQMLFRRISLRLTSLLGAAVFPASAWLDPWLHGALRTRSLQGTDLPLLILGGLLVGYLGGRLIATLFEVGQGVQSGGAERVYSVPRRFGTGTILLATTLFAILFGALNYARARPWELFFYAAFVATVSLFQAVFNRTPRWASILSGGVYLPLSLILFGSFGLVGRRSGLPRIRFDGLPGFLDLVLWAMFVGLVVGYLGGTLIAGIFLVSDYTVRYFAAWSARKSILPTHDAELASTGTALSLLADRAAAARRNAS